MEILKDAHPFLSELLGSGWDIAPNVLQHVAAHEQGYLRETRLFTLRGWRKEYPQRVVIIGGNDGNRFDLMADCEDYERPALGVRLYQPGTTGGGPV
jgi:hypothetical protein